MSRARRKMMIMTTSIMIMIYPTDNVRTPVLAVTVETVIETNTTEKTHLLGVQLYTANIQPRQTRTTATI